MNEHDRDDHTADLLARALADEARRVEPQPGGLQMIQQRTQQAPRKRTPWVIGALGAGLATAAVITAVVVIADRDGSGDDGATPPVTQPTTAAADVDVTVWYVAPRPSNSEGPGQAPPNQLSPLQREQHTVAGGDLAAVHEFFTGSPIDADYSTDWPAGVDASSVTVGADGTADIALVGDADASAVTDGGDLEPGVAKSAIQALLFTIGDATAATFSYNGEPLDQVLGVDASDPITVEDSNYLGASFIFDDLTDGQTVTSPVTVTVSVNSFEGNMLWKLTDDAGKPVADGQATGSMAEYTQVPVKLGDLPPGTYTISVFDNSPADGDVYGLDDKTFTVE